MRWSKPLGGLAGLGVALATAGAVATLGLVPLGIANGGFERQAAATATFVLLLVLVLVAVLVGTRPGEDRTSPYW